MIHFFISVDRKMLAGFDDATGIVVLFDRIMSPVASGGVHQRKKQSNRAFVKSAAGKQRQSGA